MENFVTGGGFFMEGRRGGCYRDLLQHLSVLGLFEETDGLSVLLSSQGILPVQFCHPPDGPYHETGEIALMRAVLADAISCFQGSVISGKRRYQRLAKEAEEWFFARQDDYVFSFVNICAVLGLDPDYIRLGLKRWRQHAAATPRRKIRRIVRPSRLIKQAA
jgi:hypothetical protein